MVALRSPPLVTADVQCGQVAVVKAVLEDQVGIHGINCDADRGRGCAAVTVRNGVGEAFTAGVSIGGGVGNGDVGVDSDETMAGWKRRRWSMYRHPHRCHCSARGC